MVYPSKHLKNSNTTEIINIPFNSPKPMQYKDHKCNRFCMIWVKYNANLTRNMNTLSIPLHFGFERHIVQNKKLKSKSIMYTTPCGHSIYNEKNMYKYITLVESQMTIDLFNFDHNINPLSIFKVNKYVEYIPDFHIEEFKPISFVNCLNHSKPPTFRYITKRQLMPGSNENLNSFCSGCDCTDNCDDKSKCSCWQLTYESQKNYPKMIKTRNVGYIYKRLYEHIPTGIYECNVNCKCLKTCSNRVVQEPMSTLLQVFLNKKKGWGIRTLVDIPKGTFICTLLGDVFTDKEAEEEGLKNGDDYLADLDFIETAEKIKDDFENDFEYESETESDDNKKASEDEEFDPGESNKKKIKFCELSMSLRQKNIQNVDIKTDGKNQLSQLNTKISAETTDKPLRDYLDEDNNKFVLNCRTSGNVGRYFNHSCDPNVFLQNVFIDTHDLRFPWLAYFSLTNIPAGRELSLNYSYEVGSVEGQIRKCYCGTKKCTGRFL